MSAPLNRFLISLSLSHNVLLLSLLSNALCGVISYVIVTAAIQWPTGAGQCVCFLAALNVR